MQVLSRWFQGGQQNPEFLLNQNELTAAMRSERRRADRSKAPLALATFRRKQGSMQSVPRQLSAALHQRLRETDVAGLLDSNRVAVVLPDTNSDGAWTFANAIQQQCQVDLDLTAEVYLYPEMLDLPALSSDPSEQGEDSGSPPQEKELEPLLVDSLPVWKRALDVVAASLACTLLSPLLLLTAVLVKCTSPGPILFRQWRGGRGGKPFMLFKFRTMCVDAEAKQASLLADNEQDGPEFKIKDDPRITAAAVICAAVVSTNCPSYGTSSKET